MLLKLCKRGHRAKRLPDGECFQCASDRQRAWRKAHPERSREYTAKYRKSEKGKASRKRGRQNPAGRARAKRYAQSPLGREKSHRQNTSPLGRERSRMFRHSPKGREYQRNWQASSTARSKIRLAERQPHRKAVRNARLKLRRLNHALELHLPTAPLLLARYHSCSSSYSL